MDTQQEPELSKSFTNNTSPNTELGEHLYQYLINYINKFNEAPSHEEWIDEILTFDKTKGNKRRCEAIYERGKKQGQRCRAFKQNNSSYCKLHGNYSPPVDINELVTKINTMSTELNTLKSKTTIDKNI